jgi:hypothetical protein
MKIKIVVHEAEANGLFSLVAQAARPPRRVGGLHVISSSRFAA